MAKLVLITGASSGIGRETALEFASQGWNVAATMRNPDGIKDFDQTPNIRKFRLDVTDKESIASAFREVTQAWGKIDAVLNNAGYGLDGVFEAMDDEIIHKQFNTNVFGLMRVTREAIRHMRPHGAGKILMISSMGGQITFPLYSIYHSTKWAVEGFAESLHYELEQFNIQIKIIEPGIIQTEFVGRSREFVTPTHTTDYNGYLEKFQQAMAKSKNEGGDDPRKVAKTIVKAANSNSRKMRYVVGKPAPLLLRMRSILPDPAFFKIIKRSFNM